MYFGRSGRVNTVRKDGPTAAALKGSEALFVVAEKEGQGAVERERNRTCRSSHSCSSSVGAISLRWASQCMELSLPCIDWSDPNDASPRDKETAASEAWGRRSELPGATRPAPMAPLPAWKAVAKRGTKQGASTLRWDPVRLMDPRRVLPSEAEASEWATDGLELSGLRPPPCSRLCISTETPERRSGMPSGEEVVAEGWVERRDASTRSISSKPDWMSSSRCGDECE